jgi:hypothetical protein
MFRRFADTQPDLYSAGDARDFDDIAHRVLGVLAVQGTKEQRIAAWQAAAGEGSVFGPAGGETIPEYDGEDWNDDWEALDGGDDYYVATVSPIWRFYQAAALHRTYVIRDLLPKYDLVIN